MALDLSGVSLALQHRAGLHSKLCSAYPLQALFGLVHKRAGRLAREILLKDVYRGLRCRMYPDPRGDTLEPEDQIAEGAKFGRIRVG
jgi:hypothetical protein